MINGNISVLFTDEAAEFLRTIPQQARDKFTYNIGRIKAVKGITKYLKNLKTLKYGSFAHCIIK